MIWNYTPWRRRHRSPSGKEPNPMCTDKTEAIAYCCELQSCLQLMSHPLSHQYLLIQQRSHWPLLCPGCSLAPAHIPSAGSELKAPSSKALDEFLWPGYTFQTGTKGEFQEPRKAERGCVQTLRKNRQDSWSAGGDIQLWSKTAESEEGLSPPPPGLPDLAGDTDIIWTRKETSQLLKKTWAGWLEPEHIGRRNEKLESEAGRRIMCNAFSCRTAKAEFSGREGDPAASGQVLPFRTTRNGQFHLRPRTASCQAQGFSTARGLRSDDADHHHHHSGCSNSHTNQALTVGRTLLCFIGISSFNQQPLY